jgi:hypothetical protein
VAGAVVGIIAEQSPLVVIDGTAEFEVDRLGQAPLGRCAGRICRQGAFEAAADDLRETHFIVGRNPLGLAVKVLRELYLGFYHDGKMPT